MRRLVDSLLFVLIAYTVTWPVVRGFTGAGVERELLLELRGANGSHAVVHIATDAEAAARRTFAGSVEAGDESPDGNVVPGLGERDRIWVVVEFADVTLPAYAIEVDRSTTPARAIVDLPFGAASEPSPATGTR